MKFLLSSVFLYLFFINCFSQSTSELENFPVFENCKETGLENRENCFQNTLKSFISEHFSVPEALEERDYIGQTVVIFEVETSGNFNIIYIDSPSNQLKEELKRVFSLLPQIEPGTYNGNPTAMQFRLPLKIPFTNFSDSRVNEEFQKLKSLQSNEYDAIEENEYQNNLYESNINIPLSHELYARFQDEMDVVGTNSHTASKPFLYKEAQRYYDFETEQLKLKKEKSSWFGRKLWNEHLVQLLGEDYWFTVDFGVDLQLGKDIDSKHNFTYNNTRMAIFQGGLGENLNFYASVFESQGRFADYFNQYAESIKPDGGNPAIIPAMGIAKEFMDGGYDYPLAEGYLSYSPSKFFNIQFGHGKNFIGDGYRSLFLSDNASPYPYVKLNTSFWKLKYTNIWTSMRDVRPEVTADGSFLTKYVATHYLSMNVTKRLNIGLFESVIWQNDNNRGFDLNYLNPVIFYRAIEFSTGSRGGNALLGISGKYKFSNSINMYAQLMIDEFSSLDIFSTNGSYKNKIGFQIGAKYYNAFKIPNLHFQAEYNQVRPFTYSHNTTVLNYGHNNQSLAHLWGTNFREFVGIVRYKKNRWYGHGKVILGERGFNYDEGNYGGDIYVSEDSRERDNNHSIGQGNTTTSFYANLEAGYIINPATNLKAYVFFIYRNFNPTKQIFENTNNPSVWVNFGLRTDIFNWYFDY